jgi:hypothetical protein
MTNQTNHLARKRNTEATDAFLGNRFCKSCRAHRSLLGGIESLDSKRRVKWLCATCATKAQANRNASQGKASLAAPVVPSTSAE